MLDWPEPSQTSPTRTSWIVRELIVMSSGPAATSGRSQAVHLPFSAAFAETVWPWKLTLTLSPGSAVPQTRTGMPCWRTMWSEIRAGSLTAACRAAAVAKRQMSFRMVLPRLDGKDIFEKLVAGAAIVGPRLRFGHEVHDGIFVLRRVDGPFWQTGPVGVAGFGEV